MRNRLNTLAAMAIAFTLAACFIVPGKFVSNIDVGRDGAFTFTYQGELMFATSPALIRQAQSEGDAGFAAHCIDEDSYEDRACTADETVEQKTAWDETKAKETATMAQFATMFGGINPADPATMDAFAARLAKEQGWMSVVHKGDGIFEVDYALTGVLDRDFVWPTFPGVEIIKPIVVAHRRADNSVEISAPGLATHRDQALRAMGSVVGPSAMPDNPHTHTAGDFTLTTNAEVITNNTDDGPATSDTRKTLRWSVTSDTRNAPRSLLRLK